MMINNVEDLRSYNQFRELILTQVLNLTIIISFSIICLSPHLTIPAEGIVTTVLVLIYTVFLRLLLRKQKQKLSAILYLSFLFFVLPISQYFSNLHGQNADWWYPLLPILYQTEEDSRHSVRC